MGFVARKSLGPVLFKEPLKRSAITIFRLVGWEASLCDNSFLRCPEAPHFFSSGTRLVLSFLSYCKRRHYKNSNVQRTFRLSSDTSIFYTTSHIMSNTGPYSVLDMKTLEEVVSFQWKAVVTTLSHVTGQKKGLHGRMMSQPRSEHWLQILWAI